MQAQICVSWSLPAVTSQENFVSSAGLERQAHRTLLQKQTRFPHLSVLNLFLCYKGLGSGLTHPSVNQKSDSAELGCTEEKAGVGFCSSYF